LVAALGAPRRAVAQAAIAMNVATTPNDAGAEVYYAADMGFFKRARLEVTITTINNGVTIAAGIVAGTFDAAQASVPSIASGHERGLPLVIIAPAATWSSSTVTTALVIAKSATMRTAKDLEGKTIAVNGVLTQLGASAWLEKNGADLGTIKFLDLPYASMAPGLAAKRIDAAVLAEPDLDPALATEAKVLAAPYDAIAKEFLISAWFTTLDYAKGHPEALRRLERAILDAGRWANRNRARSGEILAKYTKVAVSPDMVRVAYAERTSAALAQPLIDAAARYKALRATFPASELFR
jgi:NitT/TauT family transport system substrate-binding protein